MVETEADLMRKCGHLYVSIALESLATTLMSLTFSYLLLLITSKGRLSNPGSSAYTFISSQIGSFVSDVKHEASQWSIMDKQPLERRYAMCRKLNQAICLFQILIGVLTVERWMHINNVNGFRYLGYAVTCPPMQTELVILIAPVVPCYRLNCIFTYLITVLMLLTGYGASVIPGDIWTGSLMEFLSTWNLDDLGVTRKFWWLAPSIGAQAYLTFIQIPCLLMLYCIRGGASAGLPHGYVKLLFIVAMSWLAFPVWWMLSYEGMSVITDTKANAAVFTILNVTAKGSFTLQMLRMTKRFRKEKHRQEYLEKGLRASDADRDHHGGLFGAEGEEEEEEETRGPQRRDARSETWVVRMLRPYDQLQYGPQDWKSFEPTYRAFLIGNGVKPDKWENMSYDERAAMKEKYDSTLDLMVTDDHKGIEKLNKAAAARGSRGGEPPILLSQAPPSPAPSSPKVAPAKIAPAKPGKVMPMKNPKAPPPAPEPEPTKKTFKVGQTLTTVTGMKGRLLRSKGNTVQIAVQGKQAQVVSVDDLTVLKVTFLGARGLQNTDLQKSAKPYCSASVDGKPSSEVKTSVAANSKRASWEQEELEVYGYSSGDDIALRVWSLDQEKQAEDLLGEASVPRTSIHNGGFEGELQLQMYGSSLRAYISVVIVVIGLPGADEEFSEDEEDEEGESLDGLPVTRAVNPKAKKGNKQTPDGRAICCF